MVRETFLIRDASPADLPALLRLARHLDSYNLPADRARLSGLLRDSVDSFAGRDIPIDRRRYVFVLEDLAAKRVVGCSQIVAKHGTPGLPHLYMTEFVEKRTSRTLRRTVEHRCLRLGYTEDGPTEVGGLVLLPAYRRRPERLGRWLSHVRFLYIAAHPERFQQTLLAEFLPMFAKKGRSPFWDYFGRKFTGLTYSQADRLSIDDKEFILSLFPAGTLYQDFFPAEIIRHLGQVGDPTAPAAALLREIGFTYLHQIEPFDGGPYYGCLTRSVTPIRRAKQLRVVRASDVVAPRHLVLFPAGSHVRALAAPLAAHGVDGALSDVTAARLGAVEGDWFWTCPLARAPRRRGRA
jgi:arginine N-succinyltransferase